MDKVLNWTPIGLLLDIVGFWLITWDVLPRYFLDKRRNVISSAIVNIKELKARTDSWASEQKEAIRRIIGLLEAAQQNSEFWKAQVGKQKLMSSGYLEASRKEVHGNKDALFKLDDLIKRSQQFSEGEISLIEKIIGQMRAVGIDYGDWKELHKKTWKRKRPFSIVSWDQKMDLLNQKDRELLKKSEDIDSRFLRSPVLLGAIFVSIGFLFQFIGSVAG